MTDEKLLDGNPEEESNGSSEVVSWSGGDSETVKASERAKETGDGQLETQATSIGLTVETTEVEHQPPALLYPVVAFGASAGGLPAFQEVLTNLDSQTGMAFVLVTHLAPDQRSFLSEIVERFTQMPVVPIENGQRPEPNHLYVLLPNQSLTIHEGMFRVEPLLASERLPKTIDKFFLSLAGDQKIDQLRRSQQHLVDARDFASSVVEGVPVPIVVLNRDCTIRTVNTSFRELTQMKGAELENRSMPDLVKHLWGMEGIGDKLETLARGSPGAALELEHVSTTPQKRTLLVKGRALSTDGSRVLLLMIEDITLRREAEQLIARQTRALEGEIEIAARRLDRTQGELRGLTAHLFTAQEEERQYLARELHDDISQRLSAVRLLLEEIKIAEQRKKDYERLQSARQQVDSLNDDVRTISHRLHPAILSDLGLSESLRALVREFGERERMPATYSTQDVPDELPPQTATAIYRIAQEALRNVSKHAGKTHLKVTLSRIGKLLQLKVMDFGLGFDQEAETPSGGLGMISMQERAHLAGGELKVQSVLGQGTTITVEVPLEHA